MILEKLPFFVHGMLQMFFIFAVVLLYRIPHRTRPQSLLMVGLLFWALVELKDLFLYDNFTLLSPCIVFPDLLAIPFASFYMLEYLYPGRMTPRRCVRLVVPFLFIILLYIVALLFSPYKAYYNIADVWAERARPEVAVRILYVFYALSVAVYLVVKMTRQAAKYEYFISQNYSYTENIEARWIISIVCWLFVCLLVYVAIYAFGFPSVVADLTYYVFSLVIWGYILLKIIQYEAPQMMYNYWKEAPAVALENPKQGKTVANNKKIYNAAQIEAKIHQAFSEKKLHLNPKLTIVDLANECNTNRTYLSEYLNNELQCSFYDFVNRYRLENAAIPLLKISPDSVSVEEIALLSGFGSVSTFRRAFAKATNQTFQEFKASQ